MERRARRLPKEYRDKLVKLDTKYHDTQHGQSGPLVKRLESYGKLEGLVVGPWGEAGKDLHSLVRILAEWKVALVSKNRGWEGSDKELGMYMSQIRKYLSTAFTKAQSICLINRLAHLGEGAKAAAARRDLAKRLEEGRRRDRQAHFLAHMRGKGLSREGQKVHFLSIPTHHPTK